MSEKRIRVVVCGVSVINKSSCLVNVNDDFSLCAAFLLLIYLWSRGSSVSIVSDYGLDDRGSIPDRARGFPLQTLRPDRLWGPPSLLSNGYRGSFPRG
jgi:hypothetical protein